MKKINKFLSMAVSLGSITALMIPVLTSCSDNPNIKQVSRGDGQYFSKYKDGINEYGVSFKEQICNAMLSSTSLSSLKKQYVNQMLYNWYKNIVDSGSKQSFKDNWKQWKKDIDKSWDDLVKSAKESHKDKWKYFLQNDSLDPVGGTEQAWRFEQLCSKIRDEFKNLVFSNNYFAYSAADTYNVNSPVSRMNSETLKDSSSWKKINFYAYANSAYSGKDSGDLDAQFALIQKETFNSYTAKNHPVLSGMSLWKDAAPTSGVEAIYSKALGSITIDDKSGLTYPGFPRATISGSNANTKFWDLFSQVTNNNYYLADNGLTNLKTHYTDDSSVQYLTTMNSAFTTTNKLFASAEARLWDKGIAKATTGTDHKFVQDHYIKIRASQLASSVRNDMDLLSLFAYKSNDSRLVSGSSWNSLGSQIINSKYTIDLADRYDYDGAHINPSIIPTPTSDFHSKIFTSGDTAAFDYYGSTSEGGVRFIISSIQLTDDNDKDLPYVLIRDDYGVHLIGIDGLMDNNQQDGFLLKPKSDDNDNTEPMSQGRENLLFKAQAMYDTLGLKSGGTELNNKLKSYFGDNLDDIVISMAQQKINKDGTIASENPIFDDTKNATFSETKRSSFYKVIELGNKLFRLQETISSFTTANKSFYSDNLAYVNNSLLSESIDKSVSKPSIYDTDNIKNGLATPFPYTYVEGDYNAISSGASQSNEKSTASWEPTQIINWVNTDSYNLEESLKTDVWNNSYISYDDIKATKQTYLEEVNSLVDDIAPYIANDEFGKWSEKINTQWELNDNWYDDGSKRESGARGPISIKNAIYKALNDFSSDAKFVNSTKAKAMQAYAKDLYADEANIDPNTGYVTIPNANISNAVTSLYYTQKVITDSTPLSMYQNIDATNYIEFVNKSYSLQLFSDYLLNGSYSDQMLDYWTYLDTVTYLMKDNYSNLFRYLSNTVLNGKALGYFTWLSEDNTISNPDFRNDGTYDTIFGWQTNYNGKFNSTYINPETPYEKPSSYVSNSDYYKFAKIPGSSTSFQMGYTGLVTENNVPSSITDNIKKAMFTNSYYSNMIVDGSTKHHLGGWYGYGDFQSIIDRFDGIGSITDLKQVCNSLETTNKDIDFVEKVSSLIDRTTYVDGDPEINPEDKSAPKVGDYVTLSVMKDRILGRKQVYKDRGWGIINYAQYDEESKTVGNTTVADLLKPAQTNAATGDFAMQIYNGDAIDPTPSHLIDMNSDSSAQQARVAVVQICSNDIKNLDNFKARFNNNDAVINQFLSLLVAQYASNSSLQSQATSDVIKTIYKGNKITVYDRRLNDKLGQTWVKDYKETN